MNPQWETDLSDNENPTSKPKRSTRMNKEAPPDRFSFLSDDRRIIEPKCWEDV